MARVPKTTAMETVKWSKIIRELVESFFETIVF